MSRGRRSSTDPSTSSGVHPPHYSAWADPVVALRDALTKGPQDVERDRAAWTGWLRKRGLGTLWLPRLSIEDPSVGTLVVVEDAYDFPVPPRTIFGDTTGHDPDAPLVLPCDGARYWTTRNATVVGGWDVVTNPDGACWPALSPHVESILVSNALEQRLLGWTRSFMIVRVDVAGRRRRTLPSLVRRTHRRLDCAIALVGEHSRPYGHWMTDYLPRSLSVRGLPQSIPILVDADVTPNGLWWLRKVLPQHSVIPLERGQPVDVDTLFVPLQRTFCPPGWVDSMELTPEVFSIDPRGVASLQDLATAAAPLTARRRRRLWLGRRGGHRRLLNEEELFARASARGFQLVYLEELEMPDVQHLLDETKDIIAPAGAQLNNLPGARPGLRVLALISRSMARTRAMEGDPHFLQSSGHEVALVVGRSVGPPGRIPYEEYQRPYTVECDLLETASVEFFGDAG